LLVVRDEYDCLQERKYYVAGKQHPEYNASVLFVDIVLSLDRLGDVTRDLEVLEGHDEVDYAESAVLHRIGDS
jgi:hypothetical protein